MIFPFLMHQEGECEIYGCAVDRWRLLYKGSQVRRFKRANDAMSYLIAEFREHPKP